MKAKLIRWPAALLVAVLLISGGAVVSWAQYGNMQNQTPPNNSKGKDAPKVNKAEEEAYKAIGAARSTPPTQVQLGEAFLTKFPQSRYVPSVYATLASAYFAMNDVDKMMANGTKALDLNPDNVDVLSMLAMAMPRLVRSTTPDAQQQYDKATAYAQHAIELIPNIPKPDGVDDAAFEQAKNDKLAMAHSGLGLVDLQRSKFEDARTELMQAVKLATSPDPVDYYLLGNADVQTDYYNDAVAAYDKCAVSGPLATQCKARSDSAKKDAATKMSR